MEPTVRNLDRWTFRPLDPSAVPIEGPWPRPAGVPGSVHGDLLARGLIPDPFLDDNEHAVSWVGETDWVYECSFDVGPTVTAHEHTDLVFDGLDTIADVSVDGVHVARTENMHRAYRIPLGDRRPGECHISVTFRSAVLEAIRRRAEWGDWPSASVDPTFNYVRKMACAWGWDWGLELVTCGLWRPARLEGWSSARLDAVRPFPEIDADDRGTLRVEVELAGDAAADVQIDARLSAPSGEVVATSTRNASGSLVLEPGTVERWHMRSSGAQPLYDLEIQLTLAGDVIGRWRRPVGFRTIELDTSPDEYGSGFTFVVNGRRQFMRGVNWIPDDPLVARVDAARYRQRLTDIVELGADLVRVWGGGIYESDEFYDICDELGLLVWQDFAFACAAYPEEQLDAEVRAEARQQVDRLAGHPSLVLWNGNNENSWGEVDWGWREELGGRAWGDGWYRDVLPAIVAERDPATPYSVASPYSGSPAIHPNADAHGTRHIWDVWNECDYEHYRRYVPRFAAEFGWQAPATKATLEHWTSGVLDRAAVERRQKAPDGDRKLARGLAPHFAEPVELDDWLWALQLNQARAVTTAIEHLRSSRGICMGALWWQHNDCWPAVSWSVLDCGGRRKPAWFALRAAFADRLLTIQPRGAELVLVAVNDGVEPWEADVVVERVSFEGTRAAASTMALAVEPRSRLVVPLDASLTTPSDPRGELLRASCSESGARPAHWYWSRDRHLALPAASMSVVAEGSQVTVTAGAFVRDLAVLPDRLSAGSSVSDMLVTLLPGETVRIDLGRFTAVDQPGVLAAVVSANDLVVG